MSEVKSSVVYSIEVEFGLREVVLYWGLVGWWFLISCLWSLGLNDSTLGGTA